MPSLLVAAGQVTAAVDVERLGVSRTEETSGKNSAVPTEHEGRAEAVSPTDAESESTPKRTPGAAGGTARISQCSGSFIKKSGFLWKDPVQKGLFGMGGKQARATSSLWHPNLPSHCGFHPSVQPPCLSSQSMCRLVSDGRLSWPASDACISRPSALSFETSVTLLLIKRICSESSITHTIPQLHPVAIHPHDSTARSSAIHPHDLAPHVRSSPSALAPSPHSIARPCRRNGGLC